MNTAARTQADRGPTPMAIAPMVLQRKCACGGSAGLTGECSECQSKRLVGKPLQAKLSISKPGDEYEQEADRIAEQVMRMADSKAMTDNLKPFGALLMQRHVGENEAEAQEAPSVIHEVLSSPGQPLDRDTRAFFQPRFSHDFSNVRIHSDAAAQQSAQEVSANAFTVGNDIVFRAGRYAPTTHEGRRLIAHELTHVIQQHAGRISRRLIQRAQIPYGQLTWADFKASPPDTKNPREGAGTLSGFDIPSYSAVTNAKNTKRKCTAGKTRLTVVEATAAPDPAHLEKPEAYMDQDRSWALERYTGDGSAYCGKRVDRKNAKLFNQCMSDETVERARLLKHEQGHFDITKVMADNARTSLKTKAASLPVKETGCGEDAARDAARNVYNGNVSPVLRDSGRGWQKSKDQAQDDYDGQTGDGAKATEQKAWERKIQGGLKDYDPTILPAATPAAPAKPATPPAQIKTPVTPSPGIQARIHTEERAGANSAREDDSIHQPQIEEFRRREAELGNPAATEVSEAAIKYRGLGASCPTSTEVDRVVDMTPAGLRAGFLTAYGAMTVMRVRPGERTWDGTRIHESLTTISNTCPASFSPTPECSGTSVFTVGDPGRSSRIGDQPGLVNRFYDFHVSRTRDISRLHDSIRNPQGVNSCETGCQQNYSCDGREIGRHTIRRMFTKGTFGVRDVTLVTVTKK